jgi:hypothetical protein
MIQYLDAYLTVRAYGEQFRNVCKHASISTHLVYTLALAYISRQGTIAL